MNGTRARHGPAHLYKTACRGVPRRALASRNNAVCVCNMCICNMCMCVMCKNSIAVNVTSA